MLEQNILAKNQSFAKRNRGWFPGREALALDLMSSPSAGKTSIMKRTIRELQDALPISVSEGEQATSADADRSRVGDVLLINEIVLLSHVRFDMDRCIANPRDISSAQVLRVWESSAMPVWYDWLDSHHGARAMA